MPFTLIPDSPLLPDIGPVQIHYRSCGEGIPLIFLHGGWGYEVYPFEHQIKAFAEKFSIIIPDRSGYGRSTKMYHFPINFHHCAAGEMIRFLDILEIPQAILWGHSDGAVIAAIMGLQAPTRFLGLILEAFHYRRAKTSSVAFFQTMLNNPEQLGERVCTVMAREHGADYWRTVLANGGRVWLEIIKQSEQGEKDFYNGQLSQLKVPTAFVHGSDDPRTEPGELADIGKQLPSATMLIIKGAGHSPHSERAWAAESSERAGEFLSGLVK
ncbi:MAG: alpha/beta hydrolase [Acidobacteriota bacterium]